MKTSSPEDGLTSLMRIKSLINTQECFNLQFNLHLVLCIKVFIKFKSTSTAKCMKCFVQNIEESCKISNLTLSVSQSVDLYFTDHFFNVLQTQIRWI